jgi:hypothetical protein
MYALNTYVVLIAYTRANEGMHFPISLTLALPCSRAFTDTHKQLSIYTPHPVTTRLARHRPNYYSLFAVILVKDWRGQRLRPFYGERNANLVGI